MKKKPREKYFIGFFSFQANRGNLWLTQSPILSGKAIKRNTFNIILNKGISISFIKALVSGSRFPQRKKLSGVKNTAKPVAKVVRVTDKAVFPFAWCVMKLDRFPPGQLATNIIPKAKLACGLIKKMRPAVSKGRISNCPDKPTRTSFGIL